jgi:Plavaka transposase
MHIHPETKVETRVFNEAFTSDSWIEAHDGLQKQCNEPGCQLEKVIAGLMFWSDSTHLASFGTAKVWPLYMYFGNLSKYIQAQPNSGACHHVAYIPSVRPLNTLHHFTPLMKIRSLTVLMNSL